jgi:RNA polymerase sigma-70 factor (ECF subfamily)
MLRRYPAVGRWEDEADVLQDALLRLARDLRDKHKRPGSVREFFCLAASRIRSVLLDLHRHYQGPRGLGTRHAGGEPHPADAGQDTDSGGRPTELERWSAFHEAVEKLEATDREVVGLIFYHGWKQADVAELLQMSVRTVSKHWTDACGQLKEMLGDSLPGF